MIDEEGNVLQKCNLVKGNWEPIVSEELWWKAYNKRNSRSLVYNDKAKRKGFRLANDVYARKMFCGCGYTMSPQYVHMATEEKTAQMRYKCRWQINSEIIKRNKLLSQDMVVCEKPAVSEMKVWLSSKYVFDCMFGSGKDAVLKTLLLIQQCQQNDAVSSNDTLVEGMQKEIEKLKKRRSNFIELRADGEISPEEYHEMSDKTTAYIRALEERIDNIHLENANAKRRLLDMEVIKQRLNTFVNLNGVKVCEEMIDTFVERIIYRGNDEFLWIINLSGSAVGSEGKYRIPKYDKEYSDNLMSDKDFDIVEQLIIPLEECQKYCEGVLHRRFVKKYWKPIVIKIAVC